MVDYNITCARSNIDEAWEFWYEQITKGVEAVPSRDGSVVGEVINAITIIEDPTRCILRSPIRKLPMRYMIGELLWYLSGSDKLNSLRLYTSAWDRMSDDGISVNSNYGDRIQHAVDEYYEPDIIGGHSTFNQLEMVEKMLTEHPDSRQAVIHIKQARDLVKHPTKDVNCTVCLQFFIRGNKLYMTTYMRSNDLWMGFPNDVFQFTTIQIYLAMKLGYKLGTYTHIAGSLHLYTRDYETSLKNIEAMSSDGNIKEVKE